MRIEMTAREEGKEIFREISRKCWIVPTFVAEYLYELESGKALKSDSDSLQKMLRAFADVQVMLDEFDNFPIGSEDNAEQERAAEMLRMYHDALFEAKQDRAFELSCEVESWKKGQK